LIAGDCIKTLSSSFDAYWNHRLSYTVHKLITLRPRRLDFRHLHKQIKKRLQPKAAELAHIELHKQRLLADEAPLLLPVTASVAVIYDAPSFAERAAKFSVDALYQSLREVCEQIIIVTAYFIPDEGLLDAMQKLVRRGIRIQVFTNSLASIDVTVAFSGYQQYRQRLLAMGVELYEKRITHNIGTSPGKDYALHAKCIIYDNEKVYVGTLNLDPRSAYLNTEIGLLINSPELALEISTNIGQQQARGDYWQLEQDDSSRLHWQFGDIRLDRQPSRGHWQNISNWLFSLLPIKQHL
jgi:putative cardiolipin synthase